MGIKINDYFKTQYLTCGNTYDHFVFHNCPKELLDIAEKSLSKDGDYCVSIGLKFTKDNCSDLNKTLSHCNNDYEKNIIARTYFCTSFMKSLLFKYNKNYRDFSVDLLNSGLEILESGDVELSKKYYLQSPMFIDIDGFIRRNGKIELNLFLDDVDNIYLQRAINIVLASRTPYSIKVFNTRKGFVTNYSTDGQLVQPIHDYMQKDLEDYIEIHDNSYMM